MRKENIRKQKIMKKRSIRGKAEHALDFRDERLVVGGALPPDSLR